MTVPAPTIFAEDVEEEEREIDGRSPARRITKGTAQ